MSKANSLSIIIIAKNEEDNLPRCLASCPEGAEIIVVDSDSTDKTAAIAEEFGCQVFQRPFTNFAEQKNFALSKATKNWVLSIDADEEILGFDENLISRLEAFRIDGLYITRKLVFMDRVMKFGKTQDAPLRLFKREISRYEGAIHEKVIVEGKVDHMNDLTLLHHSYRDLSDYFSRFNRYTSAVADNHKKRKTKKSRSLAISCDLGLSSSVAIFCAFGLFGWISRLHLCID